MATDRNGFDSFTKASQHPSIHEDVPREHHAIEQRRMTTTPSHDQACRPVVLRPEEKGPTRSGAVWQRLTEYQCSLRLDLGNGHDLTRLTAIWVRRQADSVPYVQVLPRSNDTVGVVNVRAEHILNPFMSVETTAALAHLDKPRPDRRSDCADRNAHGVSRLGTSNNLITWKGGVPLVVSRGATCVPRN
jgi:hypothetical protein